MKTINAYCSACDHDVRIVITDEPTQDAPSPIHDCEVVCLEIGEHCSGALCPLGAVPPVIMAARLVRNGLQTTMQPIVTAPCPGCHTSTDFVIISREFGICSQCGSTVARDKIETSELGSAQ